MGETKVEITNGESDTLKTPQVVPEEQLPTMQEVVTREVVESIVRAADPTLDLVDFSAELGTQAGDNYMSIMYAVKINAKSKKTGNESTLHIMLKTIPRSVVRREMINESLAFVKDSEMYNQILAGFTTFQKEKGLESDEMFQAFPHCYTTLHDGKTDFLAMENLRFKSYKMGGRVQGLDFDHCELIMKNMAKFHALSYTKFKGNYDAILETYPFLEEKMFPAEEKVNDMMKAWFGGSVQRVAQTIRDMGHPNEAETVDLVYKDPTKFWKNLHTLVGSKVENAVIGHGDCWTNNFMFLYDEATGKPVSMKFIDFQMSRASSRTIDLGYFLSSSLQINILNERKEDLLRIYHEEFTSFARRLGLEEEKQQSFSDFLEEVDHFKFYGLVMALMLIPIMNANSADVPDLETMPGEINEATMDDFFNGMMKSKAGEVKLLNLVKNHCNNVKFLHRD